MEAPNVLLLEMLINLSILGRLFGVIVDACQGIVLPEIYTPNWMACRGVFFRRGVSYQSSVINCRQSVLNYLISCSRARLTIELSNFEHSLALIGL